MYEKTSKAVHKNKSKNKKRVPDYAQGFVALKDCNSKKFYLHDLFDCWDDYKGGSGDFEQPPSDGHTMTRKTRPRQPRIHSAALQTGYCAICHLHYNSLEEHIQSKKHLKLIGDDANFISLNGFLDQDSSLGNFIDFNGINLDLDEKAVDCDYPPKLKRTKMPRTRAVSVSKKLRQTLPSPTRSESSSHHLRSRKQISYASPSPMIIEEDSLPEKPERRINHRPRRHINSSNSNSTVEEDSSVERLEKDNRGLRSNNRIVAKLTYNENENVWTSGRPKRSCIRPKRISPDECLSDNKSYYKVEVVSPKLKSTAHNQKDSETGRKRSRSPGGSEHKEKGLIVKFKKLRNSELVQLNNEAENFLFPKKDDSSSDEEAEDDGTNTTISTEKNDNSSIASEFDDPRSPKFKVEDDASMDSSSSDIKRKRRRRTHAEAFILDNQKYYKFETPGSRLRYQGSFLPTFSRLKSPRHNGDCSIKCEKYDTETEDDDSQYEYDDVKPSTFNVDDYEFSFERTPKNEPWYQTFQRQDCAEEKYVYFSDEAFWNPFILPYQMGPLPPIDPKVCISQYQQVKKYLLEPPSSSTSGGTTPDPNPSTSLAASPPEPEEDSNAETKASVSDTACCNKTAEPKRKYTRKVSPGKNPRKSPRQHASTLAILSSLIHQRKRKSRNSEAVLAKMSLSPIPEEQSAKDEEGAAGRKRDSSVDTEELGKTEKGTVVVEQTAGSAPRKLQFVGRGAPTTTRKKPGRRPKVDYRAIARNIDLELTNSFDPILDDIQLEISEDDVFFNSKTNVIDVLDTYEEYRLSDDCKGGSKRYLNGLPGKKPGRKKKANRTGWPNRIKRLMRKEQRLKDDQEDNSNDNSTIDSLSVRADSEDNDICDDTNTTDSINKKDNVNTIVNSENNMNVDKKSLDSVDTVQTVDSCDLDRVNEKSVTTPAKSVKKVLVSRVRANRSVNKDMKLFQPYVRVQKLAREQIHNQLSKRKCGGGSPKRTNRHQRRMPASPKSPRMLRKPRGRWYKER